MRCYKNYKPKHLEDSSENKCERGCEFILDPVCGSDNIRYDNKCLFETANCKVGGSMTILNKGDCKDGKMV